MRSSGNRWTASSARTLHEIIFEQTHVRAGFSPHPSAFGHHAWKGPQNELERQGRQRRRFARLQLEPVAEAELNYRKCPESLDVIVDALNFFIYIPLQLRNRPGGLYSGLGHPVIQDPQVDEEAPMARPLNRIVKSQSQIGRCTVKSYFGGQLADVLQIVLMIADCDRSRR